MNFNRHHSVIGFLVFVTDNGLEDASDNNGQEEGHGRKEQEKKVNRFLVK